MITHPDGNLAIAAGCSALRQRSTSLWMEVSIYFSLALATVAASMGGAEFPK
jgi:hypothetical protein